MSERDIVERLRTSAAHWCLDTAINRAESSLQTDAADEIEELRRQAEESAASAVAEVEALRGIIKRTARDSLADLRSFRAATIEECAKVADAYAIAPMGEDCCAVAYGIADRLRSGLAGKP